MDDTETMTEVDTLYRYFSVIFWGYEPLPYQITHSVYHLLIHSVRILYGLPLITLLSLYFDLSLYPGQY